MPSEIGFDVGEESVGIKYHPQKGYPHHMLLGMVLSLLSDIFVHFLEDYTGSSTLWHMLRHLSSRKRTPKRSFENLIKLPGTVDDHEFKQNISF